MTENELNKLDALVPESVRNMIRLNTAYSERAEKELQNMKNCGTIAFPDGDPNEGEFYPVYHAGDMITMFIRGARYANSPEGKLLYAIWGDNPVEEEKKEVKKPGRKRAKKNTPTNGESA